jgi:MarR family transcriptional regulator for hemolysin
MKRSRTASEAIFAHRMQPVARRIRFMVDQALAELGLSQATGWVLLHLARLGGEVPQSELAASLDMNGPGLVRLVDALEGRQLVERQTDRADRRVNRILLTTSGREATQQLENTLAGMRPSIFLSISDADLDVANRVLEQLDENISRALGLRP